MGEKIQSKGERVDWEGQAGSFWGDINGQQHDGAALHRCMYLSKFKTHPMVC